MKTFNRKKQNKLVKGSYGRAKNVYRVLRQRVFKNLQYNYTSRKKNIRNFKKTWSKQINGNLQFYNINFNYSKLKNQLTLCQIKLNRKILADLTVNEPLTFYSLLIPRKKK
nr:ribosomal protein L20 [Microheliella maris]BDN85881.1 ribosomal protein L20 [Microheliella maris]